MPPPQLPPPDRGQPTNRTGRVEAVRDRSNTATTNSTHNSIEPEYNRTPIPSRKWFFIFFIINIAFSLALFKIRSKFNKCA